MRSDSVRPSTSDVATTAPAPGALDGALIALGCLGVLLALGQDTLYGDAQNVLHKILALDLATDRHQLAIPLLAACGRILQTLGLSLAESVTAASAIGTAIGVWFLHAGCRAYGLRRAEAALATLVATATPPVIFLGTVVEYHGLYHAFSQFAFLCAAKLVRKPTGRGAVGFGLSATLATLVHSSGVCLGFAYAAWFLGEALAARVRTRRAIALAALAVGTHAAGFVAGMAVSRLWTVSPFVPLGLDWVLETLALLPRTIWSEWFVAFAPLSVVAFAVAVRRPARLPLLGWSAGLAAYLLLCVVTLAIADFGAYLVPLASPAAVLAACFLPRALQVLTIVAGTAIGVHAVIDHDRSGDAYASYVDGVRAAGGDGEKFLLIAGWMLGTLDPDSGDVDEVGACLVAGPGLRYYDLTLPAREDPELLRPAAKLLAGAIAQIAGPRATILLSAQSVRLLEDAARCRSG
ncbi:MAG: hypothetical protein HZB39_06960, partial [Planctomycetes bacterium]|nr:hypothetical protein [Planctomycetota bacterium]